MFDPLFDVFGSTCFQISIDHTFGYRLPAMSFAIVVFHDHEDQTKAVFLPHCKLILKSLNIIDHLLYENVILLKVI
ncbi:hypothetical protein KBB05_03195 [Patescibacteria group bacterium]|nr:hypothetical protein [Patescibacteria group bacterium]